MTVISARSRIHTNSAGLYLILIPFIRLPTHVATMLSLRQSACPQVPRCSKYAAVKPLQGSCIPLRPQRASRHTAMQAKASMGGNEDKKALRREEEPEQFWVSKTERKGANPMKDPLAIIGVTAIFLPFVLLGIAIATGAVDTSVYRY